jgi:hypothetical protein
MRLHRKSHWLLVAVLAAALAALAATPSAMAFSTTLVARNGKVIHGKRARWLRQSRMPIVHGRIRLITSGCPGRPQFSGCVFTRRPRTLYLRPNAQNPKSVIYHELGHTFDLTLFRRRDRRAFKRTLHLKGHGWFGGHGPPSELFAEAYALCSRFGIRRPAAGKLGWTRSVYNYRPSRRQHRAVCRLILHAGAPRRQRAKPRPQPPANAPPVIEQKPPQPQSNPPKTGGGLLPGLPVPLPLPAGMASRRPG